MENHTALWILGFIVIILIGLIIWLWNRKTERGIISQVEVGEDDCIIVDKQHVRVYQKDMPVNLLLKDNCQDTIQIFPGKKRRLIEIK